MTEIKFIINQTAKATRTQRDGRQFLVVPVVGLMEGVFNGEFVSAEELARFPQSWNGRPVLIGHPKNEAGDFISANSIALLAEVAGQIWDTDFSEGKLKFNVWLDEATTKSIEGGGALLQRLSSGQIIEGSTAYFRQLLDQAGTMDGESFAGKAVNLVPDHFVFLLDTEGACSIDDGCGGPRINQDSEHPKPQDKHIDDEHPNMVMKALRAIAGALGIKNFGEEEVSAMTKDETVAALVANGGCNLNEEILKSLDEDALATLLGDFVALESTPPVSNEPGSDKGPDKKESDKGPSKKEEENPPGGGPEIPPETPDLTQVMQSIQAVAQKVDGLEAKLSANERQEVDGLIQALTQVQTAFSLDDLKELNPAQVRKLHSSFVPADYSGRGLPGEPEGEWEAYTVRETENGGDK